MQGKHGGAAPRNLVSAPASAPAESDPAASDLAAPDVAPPGGEGLPSSGARAAASGLFDFSAPFQIGSVSVPNRVVLAPMAGLTTSAYRCHLKAHGVGLVTTEMVSAYGLVHGNRRTEDYLRFAPEERPIAVQLFGDVPEVMAQAARLVLEGRSAHSAERVRAVPDLLDINMGCPVRKVFRTGAGSALLADTDRAVAIAGAVVNVAAEFGVPVTVKLRSGVREGDRMALHLAPRLEAVGVAALGVHPRATSQHYRGNADHTVTEAVVRSVGIPVIASGDVMSLGTALDVAERTEAVAVMVARGAAGNPWLVDSLLAGEERSRPGLPEVVADLRALLTLVVEEMGGRRAIKWMWRLVGWYLRPSRVPVRVIDELRAAPDAEALDRALAALATGRRDDLE